MVAVRDRFFLTGDRRVPVADLSTDEIRRILGDGRISLDAACDATVGEIVERLRIELLIRELDL